MESHSDLPDFDSLRHVEGIDYDGCAWGIFDKPGQKDQLGTLNILTPTLVARAAREGIIDGDRISLNWGLEKIEFPAFRRKPAKHEIIDLVPLLDFCGHDEQITFSPQTGSHWNTPLHVAHQSSKQYYNGLKHDDFKAINGLNHGIRNVHRHGGICGRGVLLDWAAWAEKHGKEHDPLIGKQIPVADLEAVAEAQNVTFRVGDILCIRTGFTAWYEHANQSERKKIAMEGAEFLGLEANKESFRWHWNHHFAAVTADNLTYEAWPPSSPMLHEYLLSMWGSMIGKLWDFEELAIVCAQKRRWTFFLASAPLNVDCGIGSPSNALALF